MKITWYNEFNNKIREFTENGKKYVVLAVVGILALATLVPGAFAAFTGDQGNADWFNRMFDSHKQWVNQAVDRMMGNFNGASGFGAPAQNSSN